MGCGLSSYFVVVLGDEGRGNDVDDLNKYLKLGKN